MGEKCITSWQPDTCGCIVEYSWDRDSDEDTRVHTFHGSSRKCHDHEHLWEEEHYNVVLEENQRKNITLQHVADSTPLGGQHFERVRPTAPNIAVTGHKLMRPEVQHSFWFTHQGEITETSSKKRRILHFTFSERLEGPHINTIEGKFPGLVKVH